MISRSPANALFWKYCGKGNPKKVGISTLQKEDGTWMITDWIHPEGIPKPTDAQIDSIIDEFENFQAGEKTRKETVKNTLLQKLGMNTEEFETLKELIREGEL